jgi:hypothetical protein
MIFSRGNLHLTLGSEPRRGFTYLSMKQRHSREANSHTASQEILRLYGNWNFVSVHYNPPMVRILRARWIQYTHFLTISLSSILLLSLYIYIYLRLQSGLLPSDFASKSMYALHLSHTCYMPRPSHPSWLNLFNNICYRGEITNFPIM